jgi:hypothetical protein
MNSIEMLDEVQLKRINEALAAFMAMSSSELERKHYLVEALEHEKAALLACHGRVRRPHRMAA